jgi:hypothetical protein
MLTSSLKGVYLNKIQSFFELGVQATTEMISLLGLKAYAYYITVWIPWVRAKNSLSFCSMSPSGI